MAKEARIRVTFTTLPRIMEHVDEQRGFMSRSEYIHRLLADDYNKKHTDTPITYWKPDN